MKKSPPVSSVKLPFLCLALLTFCLLAGCTTPESRWETDFDTALAKAQMRHKNIFLLFTGTAWDGESEDLLFSIFNTQEFKKGAGKNYVLLHIDVPDIPTALNREKAAETFRLAVNMGVRAAPTALLVTETGRPFAFLPMTTETKTAQNVLDLIKAERPREKKINRLYGKIQKTQGSKKAEYIDAFIETVPERFHITLNDLFIRIIETDPENKSGLLGKYKLRIASENAARAFHAGTLDNELNELLILINEKNLLSPSQIQDAYYQLAYFAVNSGKISQDEAVTYLRQAYNAVPDSAAAAHILNIIESLAKDRLPAENASFTGSLPPNKADSDPAVKD